MKQPVYLSSSPHVHSGDTTERIMRDVIYSLLPACAVAVYFFGLPALMVLVLATVVLAGRYTGYRLTELRRFKELSGS